MVERNPLPDGWGDFLEDHHLLIFRVDCNGSIACEEKGYTADYRETASGIPDTPEITLILTESPTPMAAITK
jgi:hypothetical protein